MRWGSATFCGNEMVNPENEDSQNFESAIEFIESQQNQLQDLAEDLSKSRRGLSHEESFLLVTSMLSLSSVVLSILQAIGSPGSNDGKQ